MVLLAARRDVLGGWSVFAANENDGEAEWTPIGEMEIVRLLSGSTPMADEPTDRV